jgi:hypothetical protein
MDVYLEAHSRALSSEINKWVDGCDEREPPAEWNGIDADWDRYISAKINEQQARETFWKSLPIAVRSVAEKAVLTHGIPSWNVMRRLIYERDAGVCWGCCRYVASDDYELGHIVDRCRGGEDVPTNLAVMCLLCNRLTKPFHNTREEAEEWRRLGGSQRDVAEFLKGYVWQE